MEKEGLDTNFDVRKTLQSTTRVEVDIKRRALDKLRAGQKLS